MSEKNLSIVFDTNKTIGVVESEFHDTITSPNEVIVENVVSHISAGTELACLNGLEDWFKLPGTPGYTAIGKIVKKGGNIKNLKKGDIVFTFGPHSKFFKADITDRWHGVCIKIPEGINIQHAAFSHMAGIAMTAIRRSNIELGDWVAVTGMGTIGNLAAQLAKLQGANVIGLDINDSRLDLAAKSGIQYLSNTKKLNLKEAIDNHSNGVGVSTFIDATGIPEVIEEAMGTINLYGEMILLGSPRRPYQSDINNILKPIHYWSDGSIQVKGALEFIYPTHRQEFNKHSIERNIEIILDLIKNNLLDISMLHSHTVNPQNAFEAYEGLKNNPDQFIGVVIDWIG